MKAKKGFRLRELGNEFILVGESVEQINFNKMITMNETAAYLWRNIVNLESFSPKTLCDLLTAEYEVDDELAMKDAELTAKTWLEAGIVEE